MRDRIKSIKCQDYNRNNNYNYNQHREETATRERQIRIEHNNEPKYYIRIGTTGRLYVKKHEIKSYEEMGIKIHQE
jgi:hypothetical protein